ncbi:MAG: DUF5615 family PIN-like protein [Deltaproteobacteria bacterium]|nr:DUF5615 family PIN-like protein [Deltaproteobacteria bacterium]
MRPHSAQGSGRRGYAHPTAGLLRCLDIDAVDVRDVGLKGATDAKIFEYAQKERMIIMAISRYVSTNTSPNMQLRRLRPRRIAVPQFRLETEETKNHANPCLPACGGSILSKTKCPTNTLFS